MLDILQHGSLLSKQFQSAVDQLIVILSEDYSIEGATNSIKDRHCRIDHHQLLNCIEFTYFFRRAWNQPQSGWKLHLSGNIREATVGLGSFPALARQFKFSFKIPTTTTDFALINSGQDGGTQAGKIITIYPDQSQIEELAAALSEVWPARNGPRVIFDFAHRTHPQIFARKGAFVATHLFDAFGLRQAAIVGGAGILEPDVRNEEPSLSLDPPVDFQFNPSAISWPVKGCKGSYFATEKINETGRSTVFLGFDTEHHQTVIIKIIRKGIGSDISDISLCDRLSDEYELTLQAFQQGLTVSKPIEYIESSDFCFLVFRDDELSVLQNGIGSQADAASRKINLIPFLVESIQRLHASHIVHNDISWRNVMVRPDGTGVLIDFGAAIQLPSAPQFMDWDRSRLICCIAECAFETQLEILWPSNAEFVINALSIENFNNTALLAKTISARRWPDDQIVRDAQTEIRNRKSVAPIRMGSKLRTEEQDEWRSGVRSKTDDVLTALELFLSNNASLTWRNTSGIHHNFPSFELGVGEAGIAYALAIIAVLSGNARADELAEITLQKMLGQKRSPIPGLIFGYSGAQMVEAVLRKRYNIAFSTIALDWDADQNTKSNLDDLYFGNAGRLYSLCALSKSNLIDASYSTIIRDIAYDLKNRASNRDGTTVWAITLPEDGEEKYHLGFAHGSIGILYSLQAAAQVLNDSELSEWSLGAATWIAEDSIRRGGLRFHINSSDLAPPLNLCNGSLGILWCFGDQPISSTVLNKISDHCLSMPAFNNPTYCHGLAAQLDVARLLCNVSANVVPAHEFRRRIRRHLANSTVHLNKGIAWNSDRFGHTYPDLWFGFLGTFCSMLIDSETTFSSILDPNLMSLIASGSKSL